MPRADDGLSLIRRLIGDLADQPDVYRPVMTMASKADADLPWPGKSTLASARGFRPPPVGSEVGMVNPYQLIAKAVYPEDLASEAVRRADNGLQLEWKSDHIPIVTRPQEILASNNRGEHVYRYVGNDIVSRALQLAGDSPSALRTLIHEARHATQPLSILGARATPSVSKALPPSPGELTLHPNSRRYYSKPSELLAYLADAGDDFVRANGRLVNDVRDANAVMERVEAGESLQDLHPLVRGLYVDAYKNNKTARRSINDILTRYFAVPGAAGAGAAAMSGEE